MSNAAKSIIVYGIYLIVIGLGFLVIPNTLLALFGFPTTNEPWVRVVGLLLPIMAYYYLQAARSEMMPFFRWTAHTRSMVGVWVGAFVALGIIPPMFTFFGIVELVGAIWTQLALRSSKAKTA